MVHAKSLEDALNRWDIIRTKSENVRKFFMAAPGNVPTQVAFSQERLEELDTDRATGCVRDLGSMPIRRTAALPCCWATSRSKAE